jgi:hypothetical protein
LSHGCAASVKLRRTGEEPAMNVTYEMDALQLLISLAVTALIVLIPVAILAAIVYVIVSLVRNRRR